MPYHTRRHCTRGIKDASPPSFHLHHKLNFLKLFRSTFHPRQCKSKAHCCPVPQCPGSFTMCAALWLHFMTSHPPCIRQEGSTPLSRCPRCDLFTSHTQQLINNSHITSAVCCHGQLAKQHRLATASNQEACHVTITINNAPLEKVTSFKHLGWILTTTNSDWPSYTRISRRPIRNGPSFPGS
jgi:hypothetical protein